MNGHQREGAAPPPQGSYGNTNGTNPRRQDVHGANRFQSAPRQEEESEDELEYTEEVSPDEPDLYAILNLTNAVSSPPLFVRTGC